MGRFQSNRNPSVAPRSTPACLPVREALPCLQLGDERWTRRTDCNLPLHDSVALASCFFELWSVKNLNVITAVSDPPGFCRHSSRHSHAGARRVLVFGFGQSL